MFATFFITVGESGAVKGSRPSVMSACLVATFLAWLLPTAGCSTMQDVVAEQDHATQQP